MENIEIKIGKLLLASILTGVPVKIQIEHEKTVTFQLDNMLWPEFVEVLSNAHIQNYELRKNIKQKD